MKIQFTMTVYGKSYVEDCVNQTLPSLFSRGNLLDTAKIIQCRFTFYTNQEDVEALKSSWAYQHLAAAMPIEILILHKFISSQPHHAPHGRAWINALKEGLKAGEILFFIPADAVWAEGTIENICKYLQNGKRSIGLPALRAMEIPFIDKIKPFIGSDKIIRINPKELFKMAMECIDPLSVSLFRNCDYTSNHPEVIYYPIKNNGIIAVGPLNHSWVIDPTIFEENININQFDPCYDGNITIENIKEVFFVSPTPLNHQKNWYNNRGKFDYIKHSVDLMTCFDIYNAPRLYHTWRQPVKMLSDDITMSAFARIGALLAIIYAKITWLQKVAFINQRYKMASLIAQALAGARLARAWRFRGEISVLIPDDQALESRYDNLVDLSDKELREALFTLVIPGNITGITDGNVISINQRNIRIEPEWIGNPIISDLDDLNPIHVFTIPEIPEGGLE